MGSKEHTGFSAEGLLFLLKGDEEDKQKDFVKQMLSDKSRQVCVYDIFEKKI